jgi:hypothetical protein
MCALPVVRWRFMTSRDAACAAGQGQRGAAPGARGPQTFSESRRLKLANVHAFLRAHAPDIPQDQLQVIRPGSSGGHVVFQYGDDRILKVPKNGHRKTLLKETALYDHLNRQGWPMVFPEVEFVHERGLYAVLRKIEGTELSPEALEALSPRELESTVRSIASFLSLLHHHVFPDTYPRAIPTMYTSREPRGRSTSLPATLETTTQPSGRSHSSALSPGWGRLGWSLTAIYSLDTYLPSTTIALA